MFAYMPNGYEIIYKCEFLINKLEIEQSRYSDDHFLMNLKNNFEKFELFLKEKGIYL